MKLKAARITEIHPQIFAMMKAANLYLEVQSQQANFSVNKTIQMKEYTEDFICKDDAVHCIILHFFRSTTSVWCKHNYIGHALLLKHKQSLWALPLCLPLEPLMQDALFKYHTIAIMSYRETPKWNGIHDLGHSLAFPYQLRKIFIAFLTHCPTRTHYTIMSGSSQVQFNWKPFLDTWANTKLSL